MIRRTKNSSRPQLEGLDARELLSVSPATPVMPPPAHVAHFSLPAAPRPIDSGGVVKTSAVLDGTYTDSVVTIQNRTTNPVNFQLQWPGTAWKSYSLKPGETRLYYIKGANLTAHIDYDWSYQPGYQEQKYALASKNFTAGGFADLTPSRATDGQQYYFTTNSSRTGLAFYRV